MKRLRQLDTFRRVTTVSLLLAGAAVVLFAAAKAIHGTGAGNSSLGFLTWVVVALLLACLGFAVYTTNRDLSPREGTNMPMDLQIANVAGIVLLVVPAAAASAAFFTLTQGRELLSPLLLVLALAAAPAAGAFATWIQRRWPPLVET